MMTFDEIRTKWEVKPIRNCPGRFVIRISIAELSPQDLLGTDAEVHTFQIAAAKDTVLVVRMDKGGLISYRRARSEEHTSELQSRLHLVCRLLLEKKKI